MSSLLASLWWVLAEAWAQNQGLTGLHWTDLTWPPREKVVRIRRVWMAAVRPPLRGAGQTSCCNDMGGTAWLGLTLNWGLFRALYVCGGGDCGEGWSSGVCVLGCSGTRQISVPSAWTLLLQGDGSLTSFKTFFFFASLGLPCCMTAFSSCCRQGYSLVVVLAALT